MQTFFTESPRQRLKSGTETAEGTPPLRVWRNKSERVTPLWVVLRAERNIKIIALLNLGGTTGLL